MFGLIKRIFVGLLTDIVNASNHAKCVPLSNQKCVFQPILLFYILINTVRNFTAINLRLK